MSMKTQESKLKVHVLIRCSKRTGKIDTTMTGMGKALMQMWALQNTSKSKITYIIERESGNIVGAYLGKDDFPLIRKSKVPGDLGNCEGIGIPLEFLHQIKVDRFDRED